MDSRILLHSDTTHWTINPYAFIGVSAQRTSFLTETISF